MRPNAWDGLSSRPKHIGEQRRIDVRMYGRKTEVGGGQFRVSGGKISRRPSVFDTAFFMESFKFAHLRHSESVCMLNTAGALLWQFSYGEEE